MEDIKETISENLVKLRKEHKLTQLELAEKLNYSDKAISRWENGEVIPDIETLMNICEVYNISLNDIVSKHENTKKLTKHYKSQQKNKIIIIKKTTARFLSIFCIVFLGASFFAGLRQSPLIMKESMHDYLQTYKWNDLNYIATYGFDEPIIQKVEKVKGIEAVDYGFRFDALMSYDEKEDETYIKIGVPLVNTSY